MLALKHNIQWTSCVHTTSDNLNSLYYLSNQMKIIEIILTPWYSLVFHLLIENSWCTITCLYIFWMCLPNKNVNTWLKAHMYHREVNWRLDEESHFNTSWSNSPSIMLWADKKQGDSLAGTLCSWFSHQCVVGFLSAVQLDFSALYCWICAHCGFLSSKGTLPTMHISEGG